MADVTDAALADECHADHVRCDVLTPTFDRMLEQRKHQSIPQRLGGVTPQLEGYAEEGCTREGVIIPTFDVVLDRLKHRSFG